MSHPEKSQDDPAQSQRFIDMAEEVEVGDQLETFEKTFRSLVRKSSSPPKSDSEKKPEEPA